MDDHFDIRTLPSNFVSHSHPSQIIDRLNQKRKNAHKAALEEMCVRRRAVNVETEEEILNISNSLKLKLKKMREDTDYSLYLIMHMTNHEFANLEKSYFDNLSKKLMNSNENRKSTVDHMHDTLVEIEKKRSDKFKVILNETYTKLMDISYQLPFELEELFEKEILKINQLTLNNHQHYTELQAELKLQIENDMKLWTRQLYEVKDKYQKHMKELMAKQFHDSKEQMDYGFIDTTFSRMNRRLSEYDAMKMVLEFKLSQMYINVDLENISVWLQDVQMTMACLDRSAKYIVNIYKAAIVVIFHRFFKELEEIKTSMLDIDVLSREEIKPYECEIYTPTAEELDLQTEEEFETIKEVWGQLITYIEDSLNETYAFVKQATYLWDHHFIRIEEVQELVLHDVNNTIEKNICTEETYENKLNGLLDRLRQSPTEQKLEKCLDEVRKNLEKMEDIYRIHNYEEQKVVEKLREFVDIEIDVLMAEINRFLILHPPDEEMDPKKQRKRASQESHVNIDPTEELIPHQMMFCRYQVEAVSNWMFGLWEAINHYLTSGRAEIMAKAEEWIRFHCEKIKDRLNVKLAFFRLRFQRIRHTVYEKRLEELNRHNDRLKSHQMAVDLEIKTFTRNLRLVDEKYNVALVEFHNKAENILNKVLNSNKSREVRRCKENLITAHTECLGAMIVTLDHYTDECHQLALRIKISNCKFKTAIRFFSENGNYNIEEAKNVIKILNKVDANAAKGVELIKKEMKSSFGNHKTKLDARFSEMLTSIEEVSKEHEHNEKIVKMIIDLQNDIRKQILFAKTSKMKVKKMIRNLLDASAGRVGQTDFLPTFFRKFQEISETIYNQAPFFTHPQPVVIYSCVNDKPDKEPIKIAKRPVTAQSKTEVKDFTMRLGLIKPDNTNKRFVAKLNGYLYNSFQEIQQEAKEFYWKHKIVLGSQKIQPTYEKFMEEILQKYRKFLVQCEICWLEIATDFVNCLDNFLNFKKHYLSAFENKFYNNALEQFSKTQVEIMKKLSNEKETLENSCRGLHSKLKPLHGHPNNRPLLKNLELEYRNLVKATGAKMKTVLPPPKSALAKEYNKIRSNYEKTKTEMVTLTQTDKIADMQATMKGQIQTKTDLIKHLAGMDDEISDISENLKNEDIPLSVSLQIVAYMKSAPETTTDADVVTSLTMSSETYDEVTARDFHSELQEKFDKYNQEILDFAEGKIFKYFKDFQTTWNNDVKNVHNLYKVKYDKTDQRHTSKSADK